MRTTLSTTFNKIQTNLNQVTNAMSKVNEQISSGRQMSKISDEPVNIVSALRFRSTIAELNQYTENIGFGSTVISSSEMALTQIKELALRAKTLAIQSLDPALSTKETEAISTEIRNIFDQSVQLANSQVNGKYIFGGHRTTGYTETEPAPFIADKGDGYWINGAVNSSLNGGLVTGTVTNNAITSTDLTINGTVLNADIAAGAGASNGLNMEKALNAKTQINDISATTNVTASLTTLYTSGGIPTADANDGNPSQFSFDLNGIKIHVTIPDNSSITDVANLTVAAINKQSHNSGVIAERGDGTNGGLADRVVFRNKQAGDESAIIIANSSFTGTANPGFADITSPVAGVTNNTGEISLSSTNNFTIDSPNHTDDTILNELGLSAPGIGFVSDSNNGSRTYDGFRLGTDELQINGTSTAATVSDGFSDVYSDSSAAAKATAINSITSQTGVTAEVVPVSLYAPNAVEAGSETSRLTGIVTNTTILANTLAINGTPVNTQIDAGAITQGLNMEKAFNARTQINAISGTSNVTGRLTTLLSGNAAQANPLTAVSFTVNGTAVSLTTGGVSAAATATDVVRAVNAVSSQTGVEAVVGDGSNGGAVNAIVLKNVVKGNEDAIVLSGINAGTEGALIGLADMAQIADIGHNTGEISFESTSAMTITSPTLNPPSDIIINELGLSSTTAIGGISTAGTVSYEATPSYLDSGDLIINGVDIFSTPTAVSKNDGTFSLINGINAKTAQTGITATVGLSGKLLLSAADGRNLHVETSTNGENITHLNGGSNDKVYFGSLRLSSDRKFSIQTGLGPTPDLYESGLAALGMAGGSTVTGEPGDTAGDGKIDVFSIHNLSGSVRYAGDRENNMAIKIGKTSTMSISDNGKTVLMDSNVFSTFKSLEYYLLGEKFTTVTGIHQATDTSQFLNSKSTGLEPETLLPTEDLFTDGSFTVKLTDYDFDPAQNSEMTISINTAIDTLDSVVSRINGIPNISASWTSDGHLKIETTNPDRYSIALENDSSNFLNATGVSAEFMQTQAISTNLDSLDSLMDNLTEHISDFGARENRIQIQSNVYSSMMISTHENLSEVQDTDMIEAIMSLKTKEVAYQAALSAASKTMQLSLVDYL